MESKTSNSNNNNSTMKDVLFYAGVTALGVGLTSVCVYGYRQYQEYIDSKPDFKDIVTNLSYYENDENDVTIEELHNSIFED